MLRWFFKCDSELLDSGLKVRNYMLEKLSLSGRRSLLYRNQTIDLQSIRTSVKKELTHLVSLLTCLTVPPSVL